MAAVIVFAVADDLHGIIAVQQAQSGLLVNVEILIGIIVVHIEGHFKLHAADGIYQFADGLPLQQDVVVRGDSGQLGHMLFQGGHAIFHLRSLVLPLIDGVNGIQTLAVVAYIHDGVAGQIQSVEHLLIDVVAEQQHGVCGSAHHIQAGHQEGIDPLLSAAFGNVGTFYLPVLQINVPHGTEIPGRCIQTGQLGGLEAKGNYRPSQDNQRRNQRCTLQDPVPDLLPPGHAGHPIPVLPHPACQCRAAVFFSSGFLILSHHYASFVRVTPRSRNQAWACLVFL